MKKRFHILAIALALITSCVHEEFTPEFLNDDTERMEVGGETILVYNPLTCQQAFNRERNEFRVHTDNMSDYYIIRLRELPENVGQEITASSLVWTDPDGGLSSQNDIALEVMKLEGDVVWLWNSRLSIKMIVRFR